MKKYSPATITDDDIAVSKMPRLRHSFEGHDFDPEESEVLRWIRQHTSAATLDDATRLMLRARSIGCIEFLPKLGQWQGTRMAYVRIENHPARKTRPLTEEEGYGNGKI